jgi:hypothetical protein
LAPDGYVVTIAPPGRSLDQNALSHVWYEQLAQELKEDTALGWKAYCKLHHGVPILRAEEPDFREFYDGAVKWMPYERKLEAMKFLPVTSLMNKQQLSQYLEAVKNDFAGRHHPVLLEFPPEPGW